MNYVEEILERSKAIHLRKREDYASDPTANPFENFDRSNEVAGWFPDAYKSFAVLIGTKIARLGSLLVSGKTPNNESIDDTFLDLVTYCALFYGFWKDKQLQADLEIAECDHAFRGGLCIYCSKPSQDDDIPF